jgi:hypothetical protein
MSSTGRRDRFIGRTVGRYRLSEKIGSGGMGSVYKGVHVEIPGLVVAVKLLALNFVDDDSLRQRFRDEAAIIAQLGEHSPNIVQIRDYGIFEEFDVPYYMMECLQGYSLDALSYSNQPIPLERLIPLVCQLCDGLHVAHSRGVIHRDLKPANIFLVPDPQLGERVKILDFGISKLITDVAVTRKTMGYIGTPRYSSPEQFLSRALDQRSDLYSLGVILYELFSGRQPYAVDDESLAGWYRIHTETPAPQSVPSRDPSRPTPPEVEEIVLRCLAKDPRERPDSTVDIAQHLQLALRNLRHEADQQVLSDAARLANIQDWRNAIARVEVISYDSPLYVEAQIALRTWRPEAANQQALEQARQFAAGGQIHDLVRAVSLMAAIPQHSAIRQAVQSEVAAWTERAFALVEASVSADRWAEAIERAQQVAELPGAAQRFGNPLVQWRNELAAAEALAAAESLAARQQWDQALRQSEAVAFGTSVYARAGQLAEQWRREVDAQRSLQEAQRLADVREYDRAIAVALGIEKGTASAGLVRSRIGEWQTAGLQAEHRRLLDQARQLIGADRIARLPEAMSLVSAIPYNSSLYAATRSEISTWIDRALQGLEELASAQRLVEAIRQAESLLALPEVAARVNNRLTSWKRELQAIEALRSAESLAVNQQWQQAIDSVELLAAGTTSEVRARQLCALWRRELQAQQALQEAQRLAASGDYDEAIVRVSKIEGGTVYTGLAQTRLTEWQIGAAQAEHQHLLEQARRSAQQGQVVGFVQAISLVSSIPYDSPLYRDIQSEVSLWIEGALRAVEELASAQRWAEAIRQAEPLAALSGVAPRVSGRIAQWQREQQAENALAAAESSAALKQWDQALLYAEGIESDTAAHAPARAQIAGWRRELQAKQLWEQAEQLANAGDYGGALRLASGIESGTVYEGIARNGTLPWQQATVQVEHRRALDEARVSIRRDGIANLARALSLVSSIPYSSELYAIAQSESNQWIKNAIGAVERLATEQRWAEALQLAAPIAGLAPVVQRLGNRPSQWQRELQAQQTLEQALQLAEVKKYDEAIDRAATVISGTVYGAIARDRITDWQVASRQRQPTQLIQEQSPQLTDTAGATGEGSTGLQATEPTSDTLPLSDSQTKIQEQDQQTQPKKPQPTPTEPWIFVAAGVAALVVGVGAIALFGPKHSQSTTTNVEVKTDTARKAVSLPIKLIPQPPPGTKSPARQNAEIEAIQQAAVRIAWEAVGKGKEETARRQAAEDAQQKLAAAAKLKSEQETRQPELFQKRKADELAKLQIEEAKKRKAEEAAKQKAEEAASQRQEQIAKRLLEEAERKAAEEAKQKAAVAEKRRQEELAKIQIEEERKHQAEEEAKKQAEEAARRQASAESANRRNEQEVTSTTQNSTNNAETLIPGKTCRYKRLQNKNLTKLPNCPE